jgi:hypothetical protein
MADRCPMYENCLGGVPGHNPPCRNGSAGRLCGYCLPGYHRESFRCTKCSSAAAGDTLALYVTVAALLILLFAVYLAKDPIHRHDTGTVKHKRTLLLRFEAALFVDPKRIAAGTLTRRERLMVMLRRAIERRRAAAGGKLLDVKRFVGVLKIILAQYQCVGGGSPWSNTSTFAAPRSALLLACSP